MPISGLRFEPAPLPIEMVRAPALPASRADSDHERDILMSMLAHQQRIAQVGLISSGLAHDINNHMMVALGRADLAMRSLDPQDWKVGLQAVVEQCHTMSEMTSSILAFARRREDECEASCDMGDVVAQTLRLVKGKARKLSVVLDSDVEDGASVHGDRSLILQVLVNLVGNAMQACAESRGSVKVDVSMRGSGICLVQVADTGPGIPEAMRGHLFRPFASGAKGASHHGLGLFIVRWIVRRLGGSIRARTSSEGTTFRVELPGGEPQ